MALANLNLNPTDRQLRQFGAIAVVAIPLAAWLWTRDTSVTGWCVAAGAMIGGLSYVLPTLVKPVFILLTLLTFPIGLVIGELAMLLIYVAAFLPIALLFRLIGRDALQRHGRTDPASFWQERTPPKSVKSYYRQF
ncbi:MAG: hypothetical protein R3C59_27670 [Planctomycetaceae bacterium]